MTARLTLLSIAAALVLTATPTALAADGNAVGRWAQPTASQPDAEQAIGRWGRWYGQKGSDQPQPRLWRLKSSVRPNPIRFGSKGSVWPQPRMFRLKTH